MAHDIPRSIPDSVALQARREALRDMVSAISTAVHALDTPRTYREAERGTRAITVGDIALQRVAQCADPDSDDADSELALRIRAERLVFRDLADKVMAHAHALPLPTSYVECERAFRYTLSADRMLLQLYQPPRPRRKTTAPVVDRQPDTLDSLSLEADDDMAAWTSGLAATLQNIATPCSAITVEAAGLMPQTLATPSPAAPAVAPSIPAQPRLSRTALLNGVAAFPP